MQILDDIKELISIKAWKKANAAFRKEFDKKFNEKLETQGRFEYSNDGFLIQEVVLIKIKWSDIKEIKAYKVDLFIEDEIRIDIITNNSTITISEETPGYYFFKEKIKEIFPNSVQDWEAEIVKPAFAENLTVLYKSTTL